MIALTLDIPINLAFCPHLSGIYILGYIPLILLMILLMKKLILSIKT